MPSKIALLDVNVLVALFDGAHTHHEAAHEWFSARRERGWATSPIVENGVVRVLSHPAYPGRRTSLPDAVRRLRELTASSHHVLWPDDLSITDEATFATTHIAGQRQITDVYLLALAVHRDGTLATFDRAIARKSVRNAEARHLTLIR